MVHVGMKSVHLLCNLWCQNIYAVKLKAEMTEMLLTSAYSKTRVAMHVIVFQDINKS